MVVEFQTAGGDAAGRGRCGGWHQDTTAAETTWRPAVSLGPGSLRGGTSTELYCYPSCILYYPVILCCYDPRMVHSL